MKAKRYLLLLSFSLIIITTYCAAQEFGVKVGPNWSNKLKNTDRLGSFKTGWHAGAYYSSDNDYSNIQVEMQLSNKTIALGEELKTSLYYTEFLIGWKRRLKNKLHLLTGLQLGSFMGAQRYYSPFGGAIGEERVYPKNRYVLSLPVGFLFDFKTIKLGAGYDIDILGKRNPPNINFALSIYYTGYYRFWKGGEKKTTLPYKI